VGLEVEERLGKGSDFSEIQVPDGLFLGGRKSSHAEIEQTNDQGGPFVMATFISSQSDERIAELHGLISDLSWFQYSQFFTQFQILLAGEGLVCRVKAEHQLPLIRGYIGDCQIDTGGS
jgi:hypothetical protein